MGMIEIRPLMLKRCESTLDPTFAYLSLNSCVRARSGFLDAILVLRFLYTFDLVDI